MRHRTTVIAPMLVALGLSRGGVLQAQSPTFGPVTQTTARLAARSRERAREWNDAAPVIHCGPAPLTERPSASAEAARPHVAPLEQAFLDAALVRREIAARSPAVVQRP
jgi:hypothetical protein